MFQSRRGFFGKRRRDAKVKNKVFFFFFPLVLEKLTPRFAKIRKVQLLVLKKKKKSADGATGVTKNCTRMTSGLLKVDRRIDFFLMTLLGQRKRPLLSSPRDLQSQSSV